MEKKAILLKHDIFVERINKNGQISFETKNKLLISKGNDTENKPKTGIHIREAEITN